MKEINEAEFRLVVKYMEYIHKLEKTNEHKNRIIKVLREGLNNITCDCCGSSYTAEEALEQADEIEKANNELP